MAQDIPGVWDYLYKNPFNYGESFTQGMNAGSRARSVTDDREASAKKLAQEKLHQDRQFQIQTENLNQQKAEQDRRIEMDAQRRSDLLSEKFGPSIVRSPNGDIDVQGSAEAAQDRIDLDRKAEALAMQEIFTGKVAGPEFDTLRQMPGYFAGQTKALTAVQQQKAIDERARQAAQSSIDVAKIRSGSSGSVNPDTIEEVNGVPMIRTGKGSLKPLSEDARIQYERQKKSRSGTNSIPIKATVTFKPDGTPVITTPK